MGGKSGATQPDQSGIAYRLDKIFPCFDNRGGDFFKGFVPSVRFDLDDFQFTPGCGDPVCDGLYGSGNAGMDGRRQISARFTDHLADFDLVSGADYAPARYADMHGHRDLDLVEIHQANRWILLRIFIACRVYASGKRIELLNNALLKYQVVHFKKPPIEVVPLRTLFPQGAEKMLIYTLTRRKVPTGGLPHDVGTLVLNVSTVRFISKYLETGMPLIRRRVTLDGSALSCACNVNVPIGALIPDIIELAGGLIEEPSKIIMGGSMMGVSLDQIELGIIKMNNAILALGKKEARIPEETQCIRCARCITACPMGLMPTTLDIMTRNRDADGLNEYHAMDCIECGCCTYVCPAKRHLVQSIRTGKAYLRTENDKKRRKIEQEAAEKEVNSQKSRPTATKESPDA